MKVARSVVYIFDRIRTWASVLPAHGFVILDAGVIYVRYLEGPVLIAVGLSGVETLNGTAWREF